MQIQTRPSLLESFEKELKQLFNTKDKLNAAAHYALSSGGKRLRALLILLTAQSLGSPLEKAMAPALSLELIHNYSLIHDDLPCMDNDDFRRGRATVHKAFSEDTAVLTGDLLLNDAYKILAQSESLTDQEKVACITSLSYYAGGQELLKGQQMDLELNAESLNLNYLKEIYEKKTASLFCAAFDLAAIISGVEDEKRQKLTQVGLALGFAFQIQNDFLGQKKDAEKNKATLLSLLGTQAAYEQLKKSTTEALNSLNDWDKDLSDLADFIKTLLAYEV